MYQDSSRTAYTPPAGTVVIRDRQVEANEAVGGGCFDGTLFDLSQTAGGHLSYTGVVQSPYSALQIDYTIHVVDTLSVAHGPVSVQVGTTTQARPASDVIGELFGVPNTVDYTYASSDTGIFTVDGAGQMTGVSPGSASFTVTGTATGGLVSNTVTVKNAPVTTYTLTVAVESRGSVNTTGGQYAPGTGIALTSIPDQGYVFHG